MRLAHGVDELCKVLGMVISHEVIIAGITIHTESVLLHLCSLLLVAWLSRTSSAPLQQSTFPSVMPQLSSLPWLPTAC